MVATSASWGAQGACASAGRAISAEWTLTAIVWNVGAWGVPFDGRGRVAPAAGKGGEGASVDEGPYFLRANNLNLFVSKELELSTRAIVYKPKLGGYTPHKGWLAGVAGDLR